MPILSSLYRSTATKPSFDVVFLFLVLTFEFIMSVAIVRYVPYTEIDWKAYMQEVEAWLGGETNYMNIRGDTGPLVYPAGFVYLFAWLRWITEDGHNIQKAQFIFIVLYCLNQFIVLLIYHKMIPILRRRYTTTPDQQMKLAHAVWTWRVAMVMTCLSKRIHSIFLLRLFNDGPTMLLLYLSVLLFMQQRWNLGCIVFSLGVSIKMNVLLFAPGLLLLLLQASPDFQTVVWRLGLGCALPQLILGWPFLSTYPVSYLRKAFELDRVFFYKWTVNWKVRQSYISNTPTCVYRYIQCLFTYVIPKTNKPFLFMDRIVFVRRNLFGQISFYCFVALSFGGTNNTNDTMAPCNPI